MLPIAVAAASAMVAEEERTVTASAVPKLSEENTRFLFLMNRFMPGMQNGMGGFSLEAIRTTFDEYKSVIHIDGGHRPILFDRALTVIRAFQDHREDERKQNEMKRGAKSGQQAYQG